MEMSGYMYNSIPFVSWQTSQEREIVWLVYEITESGSRVGLDTIAVLSILERRGVVIDEATLVRLMRDVGWHLAWSKG